MRTLYVLMGLVGVWTGCSNGEGNNNDTQQQGGDQEITAEQCRDNMDNDMDGLIDCYDGDCQGHPFCGNNQGTDTAVDTSSHPSSESDETSNSDDAVGDSASTAPDTATEPDSSDSPDSSNGDGSDSMTETAAVSCGNIADCNSGEYCDLTQESPICMPPPTGQGQACTAPTDCASFEANFCESFVSGTCLVPECDAALDNCSPGYQCCDFAFMGLPSLCVDETLSEGVCRTGMYCTSNMDCADGEHCDTTLNPPSCVMPPSGQGRPCTAAADCASFQADYCEVLISSTCLVQGCDKEANNCSPGYQCCDFQWIGLPSLCVDEALSGGTCACSVDEDCRADEFCDLTQDLPVCLPKEIDIDPDGGVDGGIGSDAGPDTESDSDIIDDAPVPWTSLVGKIYLLDIPNSHWTKPPGLSEENLGGLLPTFAFEILTMNAATGAFTARLGGIDAETGTQDTCTKTYPIEGWVDDDGATKFVTVPLDIQVVAEGMDLKALATLHDFALTGQFINEGAGYKYGTLATELDGRDIYSLFTLMTPAPTDGDQLCANLNALGIVCEACTFEPTAVQCLSVMAEAFSVSASPTLTLTDIATIDPECLL